MATKATANKFLRAHWLAVVATLSTNQEVSTSPVTYTITSENRLRFVTKNGTTKYNDILQNPIVSISIIDTKLPIAVNLRGEAHVVEDNASAHETMRRIGQETKERGHIPPVTMHNRGEFVVIEIIAKKIQYTDFSKPKTIVNEHIQDL
jgi:uncharacterized pyridoxamine 5'-phosphate oxidase family protein